MSLPAALRPTVDVTRAAVVVTTYGAVTEPARYDWTLSAGATLSLPLTWMDGETAQAMDLGLGYTAVLTARDTPTATPALTLTDADGLSLASGSPNITVQRTAAQTTAYTGWLRVRYDLFVSRTGAETTHLLTGTVTRRDTV